MKLVQKTEDKLHQGYCAWEDEVGADHVHCKLARRGCLAAPEEGEGEVTGHY